MSIPTRLTVTTRMYGVTCVYTNVRWFTLSYGTDLHDRRPWLSWLRCAWEERDTIPDRFRPHPRDMVRVEVPGYGHVFELDEICNQSI